MWMSQSVEQNGLTRKSTWQSHRALLHMLLLKQTVCDSRDKNTPQPNFGIQSGKGTINAWAIALTPSSKTTTSNVASMETPEHRAGIVMRHLAQFISGATLNNAPCFH